MINFDDVTKENIKENLTTNSISMIINSKVSNWRLWIW